MRHSIKISPLRGGRPRGLRLERAVVGDDAAVGQGLAQLRDAGGGDLGPVEVQGPQARDPAQVRYRPATDGRLCARTTLLAP